MNKSLKSYTVLIVVYLITIFFFYENVELTSDDGVWNGWSLDLIESSSTKWLIGSSEKGFFHSTLAVYLTAIPLLIYKSHFSIIVFTCVLVLLMHVFIAKLGRLAKDNEFSFALSLLYFICPAMFVFYAFKSWQLFYFPVFQVISFFFFTSFFMAKKKKDLYLSMFFLGILPHFHVSGNLLIPLFLSLLIIFRTQLNIRSKDYLIGTLIIYLLNVSILYFIALELHLFVIGILLLLNGIFYLSSKFEIKYKVFENKAIYLIILGITLVLPSLLISVQNAYTPLRTFIHLIPGNNQYITTHIGEVLPLTHQFLSLEFVVLLLFLFFYKLNTIFNKIVYFIVTSLLAGISIMAIPLDRGFIPHQWFLFALFYIFIGIISYLTQIKRNSLRRSLLGTLLLVNIIYTFNLSVKLSENGAGGLHSTSYGAKTKILNLIFEHSNNPDVKIVNIDSFGQYGWDYIYRFYEWDHSKPARKFIVFEYNYWFRLIDENEIKKYKNFERHNIQKNVVLIEKE